MPLDSLAPQSNPFDRKGDEVITDAQGRVVQQEPSRVRDASGPARGVESVVVQKRRLGAFDLAQRTLKTITSSPYVQTGTPLHDDDRKAFIAEQLAELKDAPKAVRAAYEKAADTLVRAIESGQRIEPLDPRFTQMVFDVSGATSTFDASTVDEELDPRELAARIPRGLGAQ